MRSEYNTKSTVSAILGPTNTGKTYVAIERMLSHKSGLIGFPLRLLAREVYDKVVAIKGYDDVALITGEEKIVPKNARFTLATVESMPSDCAVDFLAVDEIQLAGDRERGHIFTDRLLNSRGNIETVFLGAETIRPLIKKLVPGVLCSSSPRLSDLSYRGYKKLDHLPPRSAIVAFSAEGVYELAERMRSQHGGCAVVLGALSPRTRNAQVAMYQAGEIDYLVATDAIGMGLNMDLDHVFFSTNRKFDGQKTRLLEPAEMAQIAGRAGRYLTNGSFGITGDLSDLDRYSVEAIEQNRFAPIKNIYWRNSSLCFDTIDALLSELDKLSPKAGLIRVRDSRDHLTLLTLSRDKEIYERARTPELVRLLWDVCQIPDFRRTLVDSHIILAKQVYLHLSQTGVLPESWIAKKIKDLEGNNGDIDTLTHRIGHIRTWTYIAHHSAWLTNPQHWQEKARKVEDKLSDALHQRLTQRFVDRRATSLAQRLRNEELGGISFVRNEELFIEGSSVGQVHGFKFNLKESSGQTKSWTKALKKILSNEIKKRVYQLEMDQDGAFSLCMDGCNSHELKIESGFISWRGAPIAQLIASKDILRPGVELLHIQSLSGSQRERIIKRLRDWYITCISRHLSPLTQLRNATLQPAARGLAYLIVEGLGCLPRKRIAREISLLEKSAIAELRLLGIEIGLTSVYCPSMLKKGRSELGGLLWSIYHGKHTPSRHKNPALVGFKRDLNISEAAYNAVGFLVFGGRILRVDIAERLAVAMLKRSRKGPFKIDKELLCLSGCSRTQFADLAIALGYKKERCKTEVQAHKIKYISAYKVSKTKHRKSGLASNNKLNPDSPFAKLRYLSLSDSNTSGERKK